MDKECLELLKEIKQDIEDLKSCVIEESGHINMEISKEIDNLFNDITEVL